MNKGYDMGEEKRILEAKHTKETKIQKLAEELLHAFCVHNSDVTNVIVSKAFDIAESFIIICNNRRDNIK